MAANQSPVLDLLPSVKLHTHRKDDPLAQKADAEFADVRKPILERDGYICCGCGMKTMTARSRPSGFFEVHHINDDHTDNRKENLATACPFCHDVFHVGNARDRASAIWMPQISQADLNILMHALLILRHRGLSKTADDADKDWGTWANDQYQMIKSSQYADDLERKLGQGMSNLANLGEAMAWLGHRNRKAYDNRRKFLGGVRIVPNADAYQAQITHFAEATNYPRGNEVITASVLKSFWSQWSQARSRAS